mgnify:CR=1 FL=1
MKKITSKDLRVCYLNFFKERGHAIIPSASLIPENDPSVLFTTAGMHPLIPYLLGQKHPQGNRLADVQKCIRTGDIDEVGDNSHCTFFEMLGNWSLGDYFKEQSIKWSYEFLTDPKYLNIDKNRLAVSVFAGDEDCPKDEESASYWRQCGIKKDKIFYLPKKNNWWIAGSTGPCGPDTEIFFDTGKPACGKDCSPACDCGKYLEIWNNVFMQFNKQSDGTLIPLAQKNVDTGMGLERTVCVLNGINSVYETDVFLPIIKKLEELSKLNYGSSADVTKAMRIIADHIRSAVFLLGDRVGVTPSNVDQGYVLRRLIRRAVRYSNFLGLSKGDLIKIAALFIEIYKDVYTELDDNQNKIIEELNKEEEKFLNTLISGEKEFLRVVNKLEGSLIDGTTAFRLYDTYGFPLEMTKELAKERGLSVDEKGFNEKFAEHQKLSQDTSGQRFKGGLADSGQATTLLHTATHLLQASLRKVLGDEVAQKGSNINPERLRFDFSFHRPMTQEEIKKTEELVNQAIKDSIPVVCEEISIDEARKKGAIGLFADKYGQTVKVYTIGGVSMEMCGGPHAANTNELGRFVITKEQSSSSGIRRIKAELIREE